MSICRAKSAPSIPRGMGMRSNAVRRHEVDRMTDDFRSHDALEGDESSSQALPKPMPSIPT